ncbi:VOC family protein [Kitasatospora paracochleata]|uniref:Catechol 2,3-dioxygenase-like lactoylglutathione lyase family enzyme n=1 Tax=Kitasatospora paracochleata TaxID=58354 RepID=A0ABT1J8A2_9ACTN|nr:VOC family protein [Kitasatospora paracochleata]MCP2313379.1 catechol 2,3-dioxygenase-like lactoylglutathione lyase family enzyme [Kitasatospora paracochleata]
MPVQLNHTILSARDNRKSAHFLAEMLGLPAPVHYEPFMVVQLTNDVSLDVLRVDGPITPQHYAFLVSEEEFDEIFGRVKERELPYWADPFHRHPDRINTWHGGRGVYFDDPDGHSLEVMTRPYDIGQ